jgi:hypothetical protein
VLTARFRSACLGRFAERANFRAVESTRYSFSFDVLTFCHLLLLIKMMSYVGKTLFPPVNQLISKVCQQTKHLVGVNRLFTQTIESIDEQGRRPRMIASLANFCSIEAKAIHPLLEEL